MIDRHAHHGKTDGNVDAVIAVHRLEGRVSLIVVAEDDNPPLAANGCRHERIRRQWSIHVQPASLCARHRWLQHVDLFAAEEAAFARMGVQSGKPNTLMRPPQNVGKRAGVTSAIAVFNDTCVVR